MRADVERKVKRGSMVCLRLHSKEESASNRRSPNSNSLNLLRADRGQALFQAFLCINLGAEP